MEDVDGLSKGMLLIGSEIAYMSIWSDLSVLGMAHNLTTTCDLLEPYTEGQLSTYHVPAAILTWG